MNLLICLFGLENASPLSPFVAWDNDKNEAHKNQRSAKISHCDILHAINIEAMC